MNARVNSSPPATPPVTTKPNANDGPATNNGTNGTNAANGANGVNGSGGADQYGGGSKEDFEAVQKLVTENCQSILIDQLGKGYEAGQKLAEGPPKDSEWVAAEKAEEKSGDRLS